MSDVRRRVVRLSIFVLPAILLLAAIYFVRSDLRDAAPRLMSPRFTFDNLTFFMRGGSKRADPLAAWTKEVVAKLKDSDRIYRFREPAEGFRIEVRSEPGASGCDPGSNLILIRGIPDDAPWEKIQEDLSRLIARTMLREGAPDASYSPWFEEGVSRYYEATQLGKGSIGSRKDHLVVHAARNQPASLESALESRGGHFFHAISHSIIAFLHEAFSVDILAQYAEFEREPGSVPLGSFQRFFGADVERAWRDFLDRRQKGS